MLNFKVLQNKIVVEQEGVRIGYLQDSCCSTKMFFNTAKNVEVFNELGKGGFLMKQVFIEELVDIWNTIYTTPALLSFLEQRKIRLEKDYLINKTYLNKLNDLIK